MKSATLEAERAKAEGFVPVLTALGVSAGFFLKGFDSAAGQSVFCLIASALLLAQLWLLTPGRPIWRMLFPPLLLFGAALLWLLAVHVARHVLFVGYSALPLAPDMFLAKYLSIVGGLWLFLVGALSGTLHRLREQSLAWILFFLTMHFLLGMAIAAIPGASLAGPVMKDGRFLGLAGNFNVSASLAGAGLLLALGGLFASINTRGKGRARRNGSLWLAGYGAAAVINSAALLLTASRFPMLVTVIGVVVLCLSQRFLSHALFRRLLPIILGAVAILILMQFLFSGLILSRFAELPQQAWQRGQFWSHFFDMAMAAPFTGYGPGAFPTANLYFLRGTPYAEQIWTINSPHSILLQFWFVGGAPYLFLMLAGVALILRGIVRQIDLAHMDAGHAATILAAIVIILCGTIDIVLDVPASTGLAVFLSGFALTYRGADRPLSRKR